MRVLLSPLTTALLLTVTSLSWAEEPTAAPAVQTPADTRADRREDTPADIGDDGGMRYPDYFVGGVITGASGVGLLASGAVVTATEGNPDWALGLGALGSIAAATGVPLMLLGAASEDAEDPELVYAGTAAATAGTLGLGLGATLLFQRESEYAEARDRATATGDAPAEEPDRIAPIAIMVAGAAVAVTGVVVWSLGAGERADERAHREPTLDVRFGLGSVVATGSF
ncbi:MAG: hypothetical protein AAGA56_15515 [Myxococcota bacterium]